MSDKKFVCLVSAVITALLVISICLTYGKPTYHPVGGVPSGLFDSPSTLATRAWRVETRFGFGTAWPLCSVGRDRWVFVTAGHVVETNIVGDRVQSVQDCHGRTLQVVGDDANHDVDCAVLLVQGDRLPIDCLRLSDRAPRDGEQVWLGSWPFGFDLYVTSGYVSRTTLHDNVSCQALPGSSGGPILDAQGRVVGILTMIWSSQEGERVPYMAVMRPSVSFQEFIGAGVAELAGRK